MSELRSSDVDKPWWFGVKPLRRGFPADVRVFGWWSERDLGMLAAGGSIRSEVALDRDPLGAFLRTLHESVPRSGVVVVFVHNLHRELAHLLRKAPRDVVSRSEWRLEVRSPAWTAHLHARGERFFTVTFGHSRRPIHVLDVAAFVTASFADAALMVDDGRYDRPLLGREAGPDRIAQRARICQRLGEQIVEWHRIEDVPLSISAPALAARIFKRQFLHVPIPLLERDVEDAALAAFHGGKLGGYGAPIHVKRAYLLDLVSAYPAALSRLPDPTRAHWRMATTYEPGTHAIWRVILDAPACPYGFAQDAKGHWVRNRAGRWEGWITSYELESGLAEHPDLGIVAARGWVCEGPLGGPFADFAAAEFRRKQTAATRAEAGVAKLALNSLIGKFVQKHPVGGDDEARWLVDEDGVHELPVRYVAGGLWNPGYASLVNGWVRARMHTLEHRYQALATSVDSILTATPPHPADLGPELGQLHADEGELWLWRERLYLFKGRHGAKDHVAMHGFYGSIEQLRRVPLQPGTYAYEAERFVGLRQADATQEAGSVVRAGYSLHLGGAGPP